MCKLTSTILEAYFQAGRLTKGYFAKFLKHKSLHFGIDLKDLTIFLTEKYRILFVNEFHLHVG